MSWHGIQLLKKCVFMMHVRNQDIAVEGEFTANSMRLELPIDLDDLLDDCSVVWIGEWDADGAFR
jgi:hypothetical protein